MVKANMAMILGFIMLVLDAYLFIQNYMLHYNHSRSEAKNLGRIVFMIILMISSALSAGGGLDLKQTLYTIAKGELGVTSLEILKQQAAVFSKCLTFTMAIEIVSSIIAYFLYKNIQKEVREYSKKYNNHWNLHELSSNK